MKSATRAQTSEEKDLGVWINDALKASSHVAKAVSKANQILGLIRRTFTFLDCRLMKQLFTSLVRSGYQDGARLVKAELRETTAADGSTILGIQKNVR